MRESLNPISTIIFGGITMALPQDFTFEDNPLIPNLVCPRCQLVFRQPTRLHRCGHTFCEDCCPDLLQPCHSCCTLAEVKQPDLIASSLISDLAVRCTAPDCPFQGSYEDFMINHKSLCPMRRHGGIENWLSEVRLTMGGFNRTPGHMGVIELDKEEKQEVYVLISEDKQMESSQQYPQQYHQKSGRASDSATFIECVQVEDCSSHDPRRTVKQKVIKL